MTNKPSVVSYLRVSTETQVREGEGLEIQRERINEYCIRHGYNHVHSFADEGVSGANESIARPGLMDLLSYCKDKKHNIQYVVVDKADRLARDLFQQLYIEKELKVIGVEIQFAAQESLNGNDPTTKLFRSMMGAFAEFERDMIKQRLTDGMKKKAANGNRPGGRQAFGYEYTNDSKRTTVVNEVESNIVKRIFDLRSKKFSLEEIAIHLNATITDEQRSLFSEANKKKSKWSHRTVATIIENDFYIGIVTLNGKKIKGNHESIVGVDVWEQVNSVNKPYEVKAPEVLDIREVA